jgi:hypothetical protein
MKIYAQYIDKEGKEVLGTDGICPIDGRLSLRNACKVAETQAWKLRHVKPWIAGYKIMRGPIRSPKQINAANYFGPDGPRGNL